MGWLAIIAEQLWGEKATRFSRVCENEGRRSRRSSLLVFQSKKGREFWRIKENTTEQQGRNISKFLRNRKMVWKSNRDCCYYYYAHSFVRSTFSFSSFPDSFDRDRRVKIHTVAKRSFFSLSSTYTFLSEIDWDIALYYVIYLLCVLWPTKHFIVLELPSPSNDFFERYKALACPDFEARKL